MATRNSSPVGRTAYVLFGLFAFSVATPAAYATVANTVYACNFVGSSTLYRVNATTAAATAIGPMNIQCTDVAFRGHQLYATNFASLYRVNPDTGGSVLVGNMGVADINALAVNPLTGRMYGAGANAGGFYEINPSTGAAALIGNYGAGITSAGDLAMLNNVMYATVNRSGFTNSWLARINLTTGVATLIGDMGRSLVYGMSVRSGKLYATTNGGALLVVNRNTGATSLVGTSGVAYGGQATSPTW